MSKGKKILLWVAGILLVFAVLGWFLLRGQPAELAVADVTGADPQLAEPSAETIPTVAVAKPIGWAAGDAPVPAQGLAVSRFAEGLDHPRTMHTLPNGDVMVALTNRPQASEGGGIKGFFERLLMKRAGAGDASPNKIVLLRDADGDGTAETVKTLREGLASPSGMAWHDGKLYVAVHDALLEFDYALGADRVAGEPRKLMDLPPAGQHWMRNILLDAEGMKIYVAVGSASNIGEAGMEREEGRAAIWEYDLATRRQRMFASGLRNPNGLAFNPFSGELWTTVNERDMLGSDLVPDYLTNVPVGAQYGWPWIYWKDVVDTRVKAPMPAYLTEYSRRPEYALGPHVAALGLVFTTGGHRMGERFGRGAFVAEHGSWNRKPPSGYEVVYVTFDERGNPQGKPVSVLSGFLTPDGKTHGRPTWLAWANDGALLVSDDTAGIIWRIIDDDAEPAPAPVRVRGGRLPAQQTLTGDARATFGAKDYAREQPAP